ncbi:carboxypeptidase-like regulatory domain-containing protein [Agriterribacter sp.]|uniref:carboxypeptidase-like regulatory domain-containing protein n=1 Tax=Agriterribacter sp. TaxID=2821509 RepID=UPI002BF245DB|nr:carboxypeptidase-like regulatory domain-containing protein [Agriterribacter sp.]HRP54631.1 carboxypeptidase-like regulatory domain-containing protein [Agriterribacter sp.]
MPENNKHIKSYTAADIQRYLNREMPALERHAMEKAALEDPFLAEAIEGYAQHSPATFLQDIEGLKKRLQEKNDTKVIPVRSGKVWWSAAAAILIMCGAAFTWYWLTPAGNDIAQQNKKEQKVAPLKETQDTAEMPAAVAGSEDIALQENETRKQTTEPASAPEKETPGLSRSTSEKTARPAPLRAKGEKDTVIPAPSVNREDQASAATVLRAQTVEEEDKRKSSVNILRSTSSTIPNNIPAAASTHIITGKITDENNKPLPFVNIRINHTPAGTYSDAEGNFRLMSGDTSLAVNIKSIGFQPQQVVLYAGAPVNNIMLRPDGKQLAEVTISGYGAHSKKAMTSKKAITKDEAPGEIPEAAPADGWGNYNIYLVNNTRLPGTTPASGRGFVDLAFTVDQYGSLSGFKIIHSTCPQCNKEAIRVVKEGPKWKLLEGDIPAKATLTVQF